MRTIEELESTNATEMLKNALDKKGMNGAGLAKLLGMKKQAIYNIINGSGKRVVSIDLAKKLEAIMPEYISAKELLVSQLLSNYNGRD